MSNIEKAAELIGRHINPLAEGEDFLIGDSGRIAQALADAGLLAPESEQTEFDNNAQDYLTREIYVSKGLVHFRFGYTRCEEIEPDCLPPELAREFAGRLIAAANYAETEKPGEQ